MTSNTLARLTSFLFFAIGLGTLFLTRNAPLMDFGNYYYGSKLLLDGKFTLEIYSGFDYFNEQIASYGEKNFLENYIPVPPFSAIFYLPFSVLPSIPAKLLFNFLSILIFSVSLYKLLLHTHTHNKLVILLPLIFIYPLYNDVLQGQGYLLVCALLFESFTSSEKGKIIYPAILLALSGLLKILPLFILVYFVLKKNYRILFYTVGFFVTLTGITLIFIDPKILAYYTTHVLPRLFNNDIIGPYWYGNQSVYTALLNLFSYDAVNNPHPVVENRLLIVLIESIYYGLILITIFLLRKENNFLLFSFLLFSLILLGRYNTSYAMLYLYPLPLTFVLHQKNRFAGLIFFVFVAITVSWPMGSFITMPFFVKFVRLWSVLLLLITFLVYYQIKLNLVALLLISISFFVLKYFTFSIQPVSYFYLQNTRGMLVNTETRGDSLFLESTLGEKKIIEGHKVTGRIRKDSSLILKDNRIYFNSKLICISKDNKREPFIYNDSFVVFMSDLNQGICFYKLRMIPLHE
jgi:hypothetical protein